MALNSKQKITRRLIDGVQGKLLLTVDDLTHARVFVQGNSELYVKLRANRAMFEIHEEIKLRYGK